MQLYQATCEAGEVDHADPHFRAKRHGYGTLRQVFQTLRPRARAGGISAPNAESVRL